MMRADEQEQVSLNKEGFKEENNSIQAKEEAADQLGARWINNNGEEVREVFGFNKNAELINGRAAMFGFMMLIVTELIFRGEPVTRSIFGIG